MNRFKPGLCIGMSQPADWQVLRAEIAAKSGTSVDFDSHHNGGHSKRPPVVRSFRDIAMSLSCKS